MTEYYGHNDYRDYLAHHGILGMKWGKRNGPPYPLGVGDHSALEKKDGYKRSFNGRRNEHLYTRNRKRYENHIEKKWRKDSNFRGTITFNKDAAKKALIIVGAVAVTGLVSYSVYKAYKNGALDSTTIIRNVNTSKIVNDAGSSLKNLIDRGKQNPLTLNNLFDKDKWDSFTDSERDALKAYTGSAYKSINKYLRGQPLSLWEQGVAKAYVDDCKSAIEKCRLDKYITTYRGCNVHSLESLFGGMKLSEMDNGSLKNLVGATIKDGGFFSTSPYVGFAGKVKMTIVCPPGTKGMYLDPISNFKGEKELLLQAGTSFEVCDVVKSASGSFNVVLKAIVEELA